MNKKLKIKSIIRNSLFIIRKSEGFTLIELIVVLTIAAVISFIGIAAFVSYNQTQALTIAAEDIVNVFSLAKSRAASGVKPSICDTSSLIGYRILVNPLLGLSDILYRLDAVCSLTGFPILTNKLPTGIHFNYNSGQTNPYEYTYYVLTGQFSGAGTIVLTGFGKSKTITIDASGNAHVN